MQKNRNISLDLLKVLACIGSFYSIQQWADLKRQDHGIFWHIYII